jgi:hypothetical protein
VPGKNEGRIESLDGRERVEELAQRILFGPAPEVDVRGDRRKQVITRYQDAVTR